MTRDPALERLLRQLKNDFRTAVYRGTVIVSGGEITQPEVPSGGIIRLLGSPADDGIYLCDDAAGTLTDGTFDGAVYTLSVPPAVRELAAGIESWIAAQDSGAFKSESFGGYSYTRLTDAAGVPLGWQQVFRSRMNPWRRI